MLRISKRLRTTTLRFYKLSTVGRKNFLGGHFPVYHDFLSRFALGVFITIWRLGAFSAFCSLPLSRFKRLSTFAALSGISIPFGFCRRKVGYPPSPLYQQFQLSPRNGQDMRLENLGVMNRFSELAAGHFKCRRLITLLSLIHGSETSDGPRRGAGRRSAPRVQYHKFANLGERHRREHVG